MRAFGRLLLVVAITLTATAALAQYLPTPEVPTYIDPATGENVGCERTPGCPHGPGPGVRIAPPKPDVWGAIAASSTAAWGTSWNAKSQAGARAEALRQCQAGAAPAAKAGCKVVVTVADVCVALVESKPEHVVSVGGPTGAISFAEGNGRLKCQRAGGRSCRVETSFCADGIKHDLKGQTVFSNGNPIFVPEGAAPFGRTTRR